jgi:hypothetical protein
MGKNQNPCIGCPEIDELGLPDASECPLDCDAKECYLEAMEQLGASSGD